MPADPVAKANEPSELVDDLPRAGCAALSPFGGKIVVKRWIKISLWSVVCAFGLFMALGFTPRRDGCEADGQFDCANPTT